MKDKQHPTKKSRLEIMLLALLLLGSACTRQGGKDAEERAREEKEEKELPEVIVAQFEKQELFDFLTYSGTLAAKTQDLLYAPLAGQIKEVLVQDGAKVASGDKLAVIKPDGEGYEFRDHVVRAVRSGVVIGLLAKAGTHVDKNQELLAIADLSALKIEVSATLDDLKFLNKDEPVSVILHSANDKPSTLQGIVKFIPGAPDLRTKTFTVSIAIPCQPREHCRNAYPGLLAKVVVKKNPHFGYRVPFKYLRRQKSHILVLKEDNTASFVTVEVGQHYGQDVEILNGIGPQTRVVTSFSKMPQEGQKVKIASPEPTEHAPKK